MTQAPRKLSLARKLARKLIVLLTLLIVITLLGCLYCTSMPGRSHEGSAAALTERERHAARRLEQDVTHLATTIGPRNDEHPESYKAAAAYLVQQLEEAGHAPKSYPVETPTGTWPNLEVTIEGSERPEAIVLFAAHYDSCHETPGADDNASGVATLLEMARQLAGSGAPHTIRLVFVANEEPPHFQRATMGSLVYAQMARARHDDIRVMYSLEMLGYFDDTPGSQHYPPLLASFYPDTGNFVAFATTLANRDVTATSVEIFRDHATLPSEGFTGPASTPGIDYSDHWSFWQAGYRAILVTDTSFFRTPHYHKPTDTPETLDYERMARTTSALVELARRFPTP